MSVNPTTPTPEDLIALSSYLDNELSVSERVELEQRLSTDEALRAEFESLRETVELVRSLPHLKAPRNFTLDPLVYGADSQPNNVTFLSRKTIWRIGAVASIAATFTLVFAIFVLGGANDASNETSNSFDQPVGMANDNAAAPDENADPTLVAQTAAVAQSTQIALSSTTASVQDEQDATDRNAAATEIALGEDQSTKATALAISPSLTVASSPVPSAQAEEPSITTSGADESIDGDSPVATRTLIASFDGTQTAEGYIVNATATQLARNTTLPPNSGGANPQDGQQGVGGQSDDGAEDTEESESGDALPPSSTFLSTPTPSSLPTQTSRPTASSTSSPTIQSIEASVPSEDADADLPEAATDALDDTADTGTAMESSDTNEDATDVFFDDADSDAADTAMGEEGRDAEATSPPMPVPTYLSSVREIINFLIDQLLNWLARFSP